MLKISELPPTLTTGLTQHDLVKGQILFQQGEAAQAIFWVKSGRVKLISFTEQQMITHYTVNPGESFAETALYFDTYACTAIAEQAAQVIAIPKHIFLDALRQSPHLSEQYLAHLTHRFAAVKRLLELRSIRSARDRVLHYFVQQLQPGESTVPLTRSLKVLAAELGLSPEALSRTLSQLEAEGVLSRKKGSILFKEEWLNS
ncbi:MAG TPA: Crp/Fnr family transcriptional regulator [Leptolyngbyaceae cyanobacterium M33_DOE_097]|nr:Crp/Fnr family transcriptional regulator [Leptolyngbyaceae cyanobacterium M33_DOE_097]